MKKLALFLTLATGMVAQEVDLNWTKHLDSESAGVRGGFVVYGHSSFSIVTYYGILDHKVVYSISKSSSDEFYSLNGSDEKMISKWDDLDAAKKEARRLSAPTEKTCFGTFANVVPISARSN